MREEQNRSALIITTRGRRD